ncbi:hypothetical protein [Anabaena sp. UHCC 0451]|uniref:hypothetical protein n=1 Tax=Anabaena sp. UHCC 0451 TaxID=2055235 RepID=UPI002B20FCCF|nr:hypothetical protein [Anabaena sp. UHCC 0451]MEA5577462.1 hypothetical protein [Anabaena sp. UHCC 0451]
MKLIDQYQETGIIKAGELLLSPADALEFMKEIAEREILILGVNLWCYVDNKIAEDPGSLDLSEIDNPQESVSIAKKFISQHLPEGTAFVSFVLDE